MTEYFPDIKGLTTDEVMASKLQHGTNSLDHQKENHFLSALGDIVKEPMFLLLVAAAVIYFISGSLSEGIFMLSAIIIVVSISLFQNSKSRNAIEALKDLTQPKCKAIRGGIVEEIKREEIVIGDYIICEEGTLVPADGIVIRANDFSVNESILTGESFAVSKKESSEDNRIYQGTLVSGGLAISIVDAIGVNTRLGQIGKSIDEIKTQKTPLELQISGFVKKMAIIGIVVFIIVWALNFFRTFSLLDSLLKALTLAMSILPEEIPVAFTTFMALGAWRLMKMGIIVKQTVTVETLGSATVICTDKTGTITENKMSLAKTYVYKTGKEFAFQKDTATGDEKELISMAMWASEPIPFDPMEKAIHEAYSLTHKNDERLSFKMIHEYPLSGKPPMMTHVFGNGGGKRIIAAKGAAEAIIEISNLSDAEKNKILSAADSLSSEGYRVLGVGEAMFAGDKFPEKQQMFSINFTGLVAFYDPPKKNISAVFDAFYNAGISVKIITGDNALTTKTIAHQVGFRGADSSLTGDELVAMNKEQFEESVMNTNIFTRMFPEAKLRIINALKAKGQVVAMTGDGVNDGPALKSAHIGVAMGKKGSEIAKQASSLILVDDDLAKMVDAVAIGRKIYTNLKKAVQYIISIHIPIILTVFIPLILGWVFPNIFSPVHIIFLELIMGPTCSIIYENEPIEKNTMLQKPRPLTSTFFNMKELTTSIIQGLAITAGTLFAYQYSVISGWNEPVTRTMVFITLISANIFLTLVNRSFYYSLFTTLRYKNNLVGLIISATIILTALILIIPVLTNFFGFEAPDMHELLISVIIGFISVIWFEAIKWMKRRA
ncbi:MAG: cation-translocating P-type ATPase [Ignavibacteria bacterium]